MEHLRKTRLRWWVAAGLLALLVAVYVSSYSVLSRRGFAEADEWDMEGFYFLTPENTDDWRFWNSTLARVYYPLIVIDNLLGTGRPIAAEPMWGLSWDSNASGVLPSRISPNCSRAICCEAAWHFVVGAAPVAAGPAGL